MTVEFSGVPCDAPCCLAGVSHGLDLACRCFSQPGDTILAESPTYFLGGYHGWHVQQKVSWVQQRLGGAFDPP